MAACRTVLPFSTVIGRPSIVSVTVSISRRSYTASLVSLDLDEGSVIGIENDIPQRAGQGHPYLGRSVSHRHQNVLTMSIDVLERHGDRDVEDVSLLREVQDDFLAAVGTGFDSGCEGDPWQRCAVDPSL